MSVIRQLVYRTHAATSTLRATHFVAIGNAIAVRIS